MQRTTVLCSRPSDPESPHSTEPLPPARAVPGLARVEVARAVATPDGRPAAYHRVTDLFPEDADPHGAVPSPGVLAAGHAAAELAARPGSTVPVLVAAVD